MSDARDIIVKLLANIGGRKEVEQYLRHYCSVDSQKFAIIGLSGEVLEGQLDTVAAALSFLQTVGLYPIVVHGAGTAVDSALTEAGLQCAREEGRRVVPAEALETYRRVLQKDNLDLVAALEQRGCPARPIASGVLHAAAIDMARFGMVGATDAVDTTALSAAIHARQLPIVSALAASPSGQAMVVDIDDAAGALARSIEPHKIVFLTTAGGLLDASGRVIEAVNLTEDYNALVNERRTPIETREVLSRIHALLMSLPETTSISITSPDHLARELFTHRGAGTLIRLGERVLKRDSFDDVDTDRLRHLLETCFGRPLVPDYFTAKRCHRVYVSERYRATAILTREGDVPYLCKFAVTKKAQGEGLGGSVWASMRRDIPRLFWRSRSDNGVNGWYFEQADGSWRDGRWTVFWYGLSGFDEVKAAIDTALSLSPTLAEPARDD